MKPFLLVPTRLDALCLRQGARALGPFTDYSRMPHVAADHDANADRPFLGRSLATEPFEDDGHRLGPGVHLHWALPEGLRRGVAHGLLLDLTEDANLVAFLETGRLPGPVAEALIERGIAAETGTALRFDPAAGCWHMADDRAERLVTLRRAMRFAANASGGTVAREPCLKVYVSDAVFPQVPNRWLIERRAGNTAARWIVESDFVHPPGEGMSAVAFPEHTAEGRPGVVRVGRVMPLQDWITGGGQGRYLDRLTALGHGDPNFAAFYPDCHSIFGFHDTSLIAPGGSLHGDVAYSLLGWYSDPAQDCLAAPAFRDAIDAAIAANHCDGAEDAAARQASFAGLWAVALERIYRLEAAPKSVAEVPGRSLFYGQVTLSARLYNYDEGQAGGAPAKVEIAVGNTASEALSVYLSHRIEGDARTNEDKLEALHLASRFDGAALDQARRFREARHTQEFHATGGGLRWTVARRGADEAGSLAQDAEDAQDVPAGAPDMRTRRLLEALNTAHAAHEQREVEWAEARRQLFADWCMYLDCTHPDTDAARGYPDPDLVRVALDGRWRPETEARGEALAQARAACMALRAELEAALAECDPDGSHVLRSVPAPRHWQPNDPVLLVAGAIARGTPRYADRRTAPLRIELLPDPLTDGQPETILKQVLSFVSESDLPVVNAWENGKHGRDGHQGPQAPTGPGLREQYGNEWHSFLLEWQADLHALDDGLGADAGVPRYHPGYLRDHYDLGHPMQELDDGTDLDLKDGAEPAVRRAGRPISGRSILTGYAEDELEAKIAAYLRRRLIPAYVHSQGGDIVNWDGNGLGERFDKLRQWYWHSLSGKRDPATDFVMQAFETLQTERAREDSGRLIQNLGGFTDALLMRRQGRQLPVDDPLAFPRQIGFVARMARAIGAGTATSPEPGLAFAPIRAGLFELSRLRIVDTFGRVRELDIGSAPLRSSLPMSTGDAPNRVHLRPRLCQPARIDARILEADDPAEIGTDAVEHPLSSPVHGWLVPNLMDGTLGVHDAAGRPIGLFTRNGSDETAWQAFPGHAHTPLERIGDPWLRAVVTGASEAGAASFITDLDRTMHRVEPGTFAQFQTPAQLLGRPLALVRMRLSLEVQGLPAINMDWSVFRSDLGGGTDGRTDNGYRTVRFPLRLGDMGRIDDGAVTWWREEPDPSARPGAAPHLGPANFVGVADDLWLSLADPPTTLTLLMDPRGPVHLRSGILPTKALTLDPRLVTDALERIEYVMRVGPVLSGRDLFSIPVPDLPNLTESWVEMRGPGWVEIGAPRDPTADAGWNGPPRLHQGWVVLRKE